MIPPFDEALSKLLVQYDHKKPGDLIPVLQEAIEHLREIEKEDA